MSRQRGASSSLSLRPMGLPRVLIVREDSHHIPLAITRTGIRGQRGSEMRVESIDEVWRLAEAWWREGSQARTYYRVILEGGRPLTLFRDDATGEWSEQGYTSPSAGGSR